VRDRVEALGRRFARFATDAVVARPRLWRVFRAPLRKQFDLLAPVWERRRSDDRLVALGAALERVDRSPTRVLDLGTGTGQAARVVARLFRQAEVIGVDLSEAMIREASRVLPAELRDRVRYEAGDASALRFHDGEFDLVVLSNMIPFFEELARVTADDGTLVFAFSSGAETPIYVATDTLRGRLAPAGFTKFEEIAAGEGTAVLAQREKSG
jgi:SAM-dependent methyltransferase